MEIDEIINELNSSTGVYAREAVQEAMDGKEEVVPALLDCFKRILEDPEEFLNGPHGDSFFPIYALHLFAYHRVSEAHSLMVELANLPDDLSFDIAGDAIHEIFPKALWMTSGGDVTSIKRIIENKKANEYCRSATIRALGYGVAESVLSRDEVVSYLQGLFTGDEATFDEPMVWNGAASALADLWPGDSMEVLEKAYKDDLIDPGFINLDDIHFHLKEGKDYRLAVSKDRALSKISRSPHDEMERWAYFKPQRPLYNFSQAVTETVKKKKTDAKKKRKSVRSARKKQRRKKK